MDHHLNRATQSTSRRIKRLNGLLDIEMVRYHLLDSVHLPVGNQLQSSGITARRNTIQLTEDLSLSQTTYSLQ